MWKSSYTHHIPTFFITGLTLATEDDADVVPGRPIYISALQEDGLAERTKTIQVEFVLFVICNRFRFFNIVKFCMLY